MSRVVVLSNLEVAAHMSGPAIRAWNIALLLSESHDVTLAAPGRCDLPAGQARLYEFDRADPLRDLIETADVLIAQALGPRQVRAALRSGTRIIFDAYDPVALEALNAKHGGGRRIRRDVAVHQANTDMMLLAASKIICASSRQRDFWYGNLASLGRLATDPNPDELISVVPFGITDSTPNHRASKRLRKEFGIDADALVAVWAGGVWPWLDPWTAIEAMEGLVISAPSIKLVLLGIRRPDATTLEAEIADAFLRRVGGSGWISPNVYVNDGWVPYEERDSYLLDADIGISLAPDTLETRYAFRTRVLDHLWCGLPSLLSTGDELADRGRDEGWALTVAPGDSRATAEALRVLESDPKMRTDLRVRAAQAADELRWTRALEPLRHLLNDANQDPPKFSRDVRAATRDVYRRKIRNPRTLSAAIGAKTRRLTAQVGSGRANTNKSRT